MGHLTLRHGCGGGRRSGGLKEEVLDYRPQLRNGFSGIDRDAQVRAIVGDMPLLVPGIGAQGGDIAATVAAGRTRNGTGMMINSSRAILYAKPRAESDEDYAQCARRAAFETRDAINSHRGRIS